MDTMTLALPGDMRAFVEAKAAEEGHASASDYVRDLILREQRRQAKRQLEAMLLKGLEGPAVEMTEEDWDSIEREAREGAGDWAYPRRRILGRHPERDDLG